MVSLPMRQRHRVTTFHASDSRCLRPTLSAGGISARVGDHKKYPTYPLTILVQAYQFLWLVKYHDSYKCSHMLAIASYPSASPGWNFQERFYLAVSSPYYRVLRHIVRKASYPSWVHHERMLPQDRSDGTLGSNRDYSPC